MVDLRTRELALAAVSVGLLVLAGCGTSPAPDQGTGHGAPAGPLPKAGPLSPTPRASPAGAHDTHPRAKSAARIAFVDVGQGDAILIRSGPADVLIDGGPEGSEGAVAATMKRIGIKDLDTVVVSHMHADHMAASDELSEAFDPERLLVAGPPDGELVQAARSVGATLVQTRRGDTYLWGAVKAQVLSPGSISGDDNADSVVLLLEVAGRRLLLTGDLTGPNEDIVAGICARGPPLYLLKVAHHGSSYSTDSGFLADADPGFAVISVGANSYGHPTPETVSRLRSSGARIYTTQRNGTITLTISPSGAVKWQFTKSSKPVTKVTAAGSQSLRVAVAGRTSTGPRSRVYATDTGECYHRGDCRYLSKSRIPMSLKDAKAKGYRPCSVCRPAI